MFKKEFLSSVLAAGLLAAACAAQVPAPVLEADLAFAARKGKTENVRELLDRGVNAKTKDLFGQPAVLLAGLHTFGDSHLEIIDLLLKHGSDIDGSNDFGTTALMITQTPSRYLNYDEFFKKRGADFRKTDKYGGSYEVYTEFGTQKTFPPYVPESERREISERDIIWRYLLEGNLARLDDPKCCGVWNNGASVLMGLAFYDYSYLFEQAVLKDAALLEDSDKEGRGPLHYAAMGNCADCFFVGFSPGRDRLNAGDRNGRTAAAYAAIHGHDDVLFKLIKLGASPSVADRLGNTPLGYAAAYGRPQAVMALLMGGADPAVDKFEDAPAIVAAAKSGREDVIGMISALKITALLGSEGKDTDSEADRRLLAISKIDFNAVDPQGNTALIYAAWSGSVKMAASLLAAGADPTLKNANGLTAAQIAGKKGHSEFVKFIDDVIKEGVTTNF